MMSTVEFDRTPLWLNFVFVQAFRDRAAFSIIERAASGLGVDKRLVEFAVEVCRGKSQVRAEARLKFKASDS